MPAAYSLRVTTPPAVEPLTVEEAKAHLRLLVSDDDAIVGSYVKAAREWVEEMGSLAPITQTIEMRIDRFPGQYPYGFPGQYDFVPHRTTLTWIDRYAIQIPRTPLVSISSISYVDTNGVTQTMDASLYQVSLGGRNIPGRVTPVYGQTWPIARAQMDAVLITFIAGYGSAPSSVPESVRSLIRLLVAHQYEFREPVVTGTIVNELPHAIQTLFWQVRAPIAA